MNLKSKIIISAALLTLLTAPASARIDGDEGGLSAYPRFGSERSAAKELGASSDVFVNRPQARR